MTHPPTLTERHTPNCLHCGEPLGAGLVAEFTLPDGRSLLVRQTVPATHPECGLRLAIGSAGHVNGTCSCYCQDNPRSDPPGLTTRQAARAAVMAYFLTHPDPSHCADD